MRKLQIAIIGSAGPEEYKKSSPPDPAIFKIAYRMGEIVAREKAILVTGGKGGIMKSASKGAKKAGGITVGVINGSQRNKANKFIDVEVVSGLNNCGEEAILISMVDGLIAIGGGSGTLQEIANAYRMKKPIIAFSNIPGWSKKTANLYLDKRKKTKIIGVKTPEKAIKVLLKKIKMLSSEKEKTCREKRLPPKL